MRVSLWVPCWTQRENLTLARMFTNEGSFLKKWLQFSWVAKCSTSSFEFLYFVIPFSLGNGIFVEMVVWEMDNVCDRSDKNWVLWFWKQVVGYEVFRGIMVEDLMVGLVKDLTVCFVNFHILCCLSLFCWVVYFGLFGYTKKNDSGKILVRFLWIN